MTGTTDMDGRCGFSYTMEAVDGHGMLFIVAKDSCPEKEKVLDYIIARENLDPICKPEITVHEGQYNYEPYSDWEEYNSVYHSSTALLPPNLTPVLVPVWFICLGDRY